MAKVKLSKVPEFNLKKLVVVVFLFATLLAGIYLTLNQTYFGASAACSAPNCSKYSGTTLRKCLDVPKVKCGGSHYYGCGWREIAKKCEVYYK